MNASGAPEFDDDPRCIARPAAASSAPVVADFPAKAGVAQDRNSTGPGPARAGNDVGSSIAERRQTNGTPFETGVTILHRTAVLRSPQQEKSQVAGPGSRIVNARPTTAYASRPSGKRARLGDVFQLKRALPRRFPPLFLELWPPQHLSNSVNRRWSELVSGRSDEGNSAIHVGHHQNGCAFDSFQFGLREHWTAANLGRVRFVAIGRRDDHGLRLAPRPIVPLLVEDQDVKQLTILVSEWTIKNQMQARIAGSPDELQERKRPPTGIGQKRQRGKYHQEHCKQNSRRLSKFDLVVFSWHRAFLAIQIQSNVPDPLGKVGFVHDVVVDSRQSWHFRRSHLESLKNIEPDGQLRRW